VGEHDRFIDARFSSGAFKLLNELLRTSRLDIDANTAALVLALMQPGAAAADEEGRGEAALLHAAAMLVKSHGQGSPALEQLGQSAAATALVDLAITRLDGYGAAASSQVAAAHAYLGLQRPDFWAAVAASPSCRAAWDAQAATHAVGVRQAVR